MICKWYVIISTKFVNIAVKLLIRICQTHSFTEDWVLAVEHTI